MDDDLRKKLLAVEVLLEIPDQISDGLESELYALRDKLHVEALSQPSPGAAALAVPFSVPVWQETSYLLRSPANARRLMEAVARDKTGSD